MKVLVIKNSESFLAGLDLLLKHFIKGMQEAGAEYEVVNLNMMNIKACKICTEDITFYENGKCQCDDDMQLIYPKLKEYNNWVFATPFTGKLPGKLINFLDRLGPLFNADHEHIDLEYNGKAALVSTTAHYEEEFFDVLTQHFEDFCPVVSKKLIGNVERPHSPALDYAETDIELIKDVLDASERLGYQFVAQSEFDINDLKIVSKPLITKLDYIQLNEVLYT